MDQRYKIKSHRALELGPLLLAFPDHFIKILANFIYPTTLAKFVFNNYYQSNQVSKIDGSNYNVPDRLNQFKLESD